MNIKQAMNEAMALSRNGAAMAVVMVAAGSYLVVADSLADDPVAIAHGGRIVYQEAQPCA